MGSPNSSAVRAFVRKQKVACSEIILRVEASQLPHLRDPDPHVIWTHLRSLHQSRGFASRLTLRRHFITMKKSDSQSIQSWVADVCCIVFHLEEISVDIPNEDIILVLTACLSNSYEPLIVSLNSVVHNTLTLDFIIFHLLNKEAC